MRLQYQQLTVRDALVSDADILSVWWNDGRVMAHAGFPLGLNESVQTIADSLSLDTEEHRRLIIEFSARPIGEMCYRIRPDASAEIGIKICDFSMQEKGYGKIVLSLLIKELFRRGCPEIVLDTNLNNKRAQHVYEHLGFQKTGVRADCWLDQLGVPQSAVDYRLRPENFLDFAIE